MVIVGKREEEEIIKPEGLPYPSSTYPNVDD